MRGSNLGEYKLDLVENKPLVPVLTIVELVWKLPAVTQLMLSFFTEVNERGNASYLANFGGWNQNWPKKPLSELANSEWYNYWLNWAAGSLPGDLDWLSPEIEKKRKSGEKWVLQRKHADHKLVGAAGPPTRICESKNGILPPEVEQWRTQLEPFQKCPGLSFTIATGLKSCKKIVFKEKDWVRRCLGLFSTTDAGLKSFKIVRKDWVRRLAEKVQRCLELFSTTDAGLLEAMTSFSLQQSWQHSTSHGRRGNHYLQKTFPFREKKTFCTIICKSLFVQAGSVDSGACWCGAWRRWRLSGAFFCSIGD